MRITTFLLCLLALSCTPKDKVGEPYRGWHEGELDIHLIYTGRGEADFYILPDGTSMLVDAGDHQASVPMTDPKPDLSRRGGEWVARYIERVNPHGNEVDYFMLSHFHNDHMGSADLDVPTTEGRGEDYKLIGVADVGEHIRFKQFFDRGYPDYDYPVKVNRDIHTDNYLKFIDYHKRTYGATQEAFKVGHYNQIALKYDPIEYTQDISILNLAANGEVVNEDGTTTRYYDLHPDNTATYGNENTKSLAFRIDYGSFTYFAGGDVSGHLKLSDGEWVNIEAKVGEACGEADVAKCSHHAYLDSMHPDFLRHTRAKAYVDAVWDQYHTQPSIIERVLSQDIYPGERMFYSQYIVEKARKEHADKEWMKGVCPYDGHIVIKAYERGEKFKIYRISAEDEQMTVQAIYGPFDAK